MRRLPRFFVERYGIAVFSIGLATSLRLLLNPVLGDHFPFATLFLAVLVTAWHGGFGPATVATLLGAVLSARFLLPPYGSFALHDFEHQAGLAFYIVVGLSIAALGGAMRRTSTQASADAARAALQREQLRTTLGSIGDGVLTTDANGRVVFLNGVAESLTGWSSESAAGMPVEAVFHIVNEQSGQIVDNPVQRVLAEGVIVGLANHTVLIAKDGSRRPIDDSGAPIKDVSGKVVGAVLVFRDVTERRRAEHTQRRLAAIIESSDDAIIAKELDGTITSWNRGAERLYGYAAEEILGKPFSILVPPERSEEGREFAERLRRGERLDHFETVRRRKDGGLIDVSVSYSPVKNADGKVVGVAVIARDITERKRADQAAREWQRHLQLVTDIAPVCLAHCDTKHRFKFVNKPYAERFSLHPRDIVGKSIVQVLGDKAFAALAPHVEAALGGKHVEFEVEIAYRDLGPRLVRAAYEPEIDDAGRVVGYVAAVLDVTESKRIERALREVEARFAAVVNHMPACVFAKDRQGRYILANRALAQLVGRRQDEFPGRTDYDFFPPEVAERFGRDDASIIESGKPRTYEEWFPHDGETRTYLTVKFPLRDDNGIPYAACAVATEVTELKRAQESLQSTAERLNVALAAARLGDWSWDAATDLVDFPDRAAEIFGIAPGKRMTWTRMLTQLLHEEDRNRARLRVEQAVAERGQYEIEYRVNRPDGAQVWVAAFGRAHYSPSGEPLGMFGVVQDITPRKEAEQALRESEERFRLLTEVIPQLVWSSQPDGRIDYCNSRWLDYAGMTQEEAQREGWAAVLHPDDLPATLAAWRNATASEGAYQVEQRLRGKDGQYRWFLTRALPLRGGDGALRKWYGTCTDIEDQKRARESLKTSEERLRLALEAGRMGVWDWNIKTNEINWSENLEQIHGLAPGSFGGTMDAFQQLVYPDDRPSLNQALAHSLEARASYDFEFRALWPDGSVHWMAGKGKVFIDDGQPLRMVGVGMDVTARKRAEQDARFLADASAALAALVDYESTLQKVARLAVPHFADWVTVDMLNDAGTLRRVAVSHTDPAKVELAHEVHRRFPPDPANPSGVWNVLRTGNAELVSEISDDLLETSVKDKELLMILRDLGLRSYMGAPLNVRGKTLGVITFLTAETGRRYDQRDLAMAEDLAHRAAVAIENARLYQEVREADRRKDEFLSLLAHELRNPLAPIRNALQILKLAGPENGVVTKAREMAERQVHALTRIVDDLLDVSRIMRGKIELRRERVDVASVVARAVETARPAIDGNKHELEIALPREPIWIDADVVRMAQVVSNLLLNAAKYTDGGGRISVTTDREGDLAVIRVRDTGIGIAPEALPLMWDMFMQVDSSGARAQGGLGIGLTVVRNLVELHGGAVNAHSPGLGQGSEFVVYLPISQVPSANAVPGPMNAAEPSARLRILVVDDNVDAAESLAMILTLDGHDVQVAHDGPAGLALAEAAPPNVAFLDIGMPRMSGTELARRFRESPALRNVTLVAMTGWGQEEDRRRTKEAGFDHHLVKPVEPDQLHRLFSSPLVREG